RGTTRLASYYILRSLEPEPFWGLPIAILNPEDSAYTDTGLDRDRTYYYTIASATSEGHIGPLATVVDVLPDRPYTPPRPTARRGDGSVTLTWAFPSEPDVVAHRIYRRRETEEWLPVVETSARGWFTDMTAENAVVYEYRIGAVSALGNESFPSDPVIGLAFAFGGLPLVIDHTPSDASSLTLKDSVRAVWERLIGEEAVSYRDADPLTVAPFGLDVYNDHAALFVVADGRFALRPETQAQLSLYAYAEGALILSGRDLFNDEPITEGTVTFGPGDFPYDALGITGAYYPRVLLSSPTRMNAEFVGARAARAGLPDLAADSTRTDWGLNPALTSTRGAVPFVGYFDVDTARAEVIYTFVSNQGSLSSLHGKPVAIVSRDPASHAAAFAFPLSYVDETAARGVLVDLLRESGWRSTRRGDIDGDGNVTLSDAVSLIDYLYRRGTLFIPENADVTAGDGETNIADVMTILAYVTHGTPLPR
ncbi:MAG TPA: dockerin type I repeat-containing protein, partial [Acidobacteriota bacterium]|nr:dockerin type I repeat-containing protein [Acidobacteriota bacterium]